VCVDLFPRTVDAAAGSYGRSVERNEPEVGSVELHGVGVVDDDWRRLGGVGYLAAAEAFGEGVVEELSPDESPLTHVALGVQRQPRVIDDSVADVTGVRGIDRLAQAVGIVGGGHPRVVRVGHAPRRVSGVVVGAVQALHLPHTQKAPIRPVVGGVGRSDAGQAHTSEHTQGRQRGQTSSRPAAIVS